MNVHSRTALQTVKAVVETIKNIPVVGGLLIPPGVLESIDAAIFAIDALIVLVDIIAAIPGLP